MQDNVIKTHTFILSSSRKPKYDAMIALNNYNYYPRTMVRLCNISYLDINAIAGAVNQLSLEVVWGPAQLVSSWDIPYSLMFIAKNATTGEFTVVIRGTNFDSWESWMNEDFDIGSTQLFNLLAPHAPSNALISNGTYNGMVDLIKLRDPTTGQSAIEFLKAEDPRIIYVTGHSLGGTLTPTMFAYINDILYNGEHVHNMALWSFAGLTPGDQGFNEYFNGLGNPEFQWRLHNTLDIAPFCWWSLDNIRDIYKPYDLDWGWPEDDFIKNLFKKAEGIGYAQPLGDQPLPGVFDKSIIDENLWTMQALHQHHVSTYISLVDQAYPS